MVQGGIFLRKMPLGIEDSVKTRIETAVVVRSLVVKDIMERLCAAEM
jgi:hypothetical protein